MLVSLRVSNPRRETLTLRLCGLVYDAGHRKEPLMVATIFGILILLCGAFLLSVLLFSPENEDFHFGRPRQNK